MDEFRRKPMCEDTTAASMGANRIHSVQCNAGRGMDQGSSWQAWITAIRLNAIPDSGIRKSIPAKFLRPPRDGEFLYL